MDTGTIKAVVKIAHKFLRIECILGTLNFAIIMPKSLTVQNTG